MLEVRWLLDEALHNYLQKLESKVQNSFNRMKTPGCDGNTSNSESSAGSGRKWELLARAADRSTYGCHRKSIFGNYIYVLIKTLWNDCWNSPLQYLPGSINLHLQLTLRIIWCRNTRWWIRKTVCLYCVGAFFLFFRKPLGWHSYTCWLYF